jgi:hypothetical protein
LGYFFPTAKICSSFDKYVLATFLAIFKQTHLVTLVPSFVYTTFVVVDLSRVSESESLAFCLQMQILTRFRVPRFLFEFLWGFRPKGTIEHFMFETGKRNLAPRYVHCKKEQLQCAHCVAQPFFVKIDTRYIIRKKLPKILCYFCNFYKTAQSKRSPSGQKFAQSGHPELCVVRSNPARV